jgi:hypothetical protein
MMPEMMTGIGFIRGYDKPGTKVDCTGPPQAKVQRTELVFSTIWTDGILEEAKLDMICQYIIWYKSAQAVWKKF